MNIPLFYPYVSPRAIEAVRRVLNSKWIGQAELVDEFENSFSKKFGFQYCVMTNSGTAALHLAYLLSGLEKGDEVVGSVLTCTAAHHPLFYVGAKIRFSDVNPDTLNMDTTTISHAVTNRTKAIVVTHLGGLAVPRASLPTNATVIEDACQAIGAKTIGWGTFTCFSFQAIKTLTCGDGGMLICRNKSDYLKARRLRWFGIDRDEKKRQGWQAWNNRGITSDQTEVGYKYQPTDIDAAIALANLNDIDMLLEHRKTLVDRYRDCLQEIKGLKMLSSGDNANWLFTVKVERREDFARKLASAGIETNLVHVRNDIITLFGGKRHHLPGMNSVEKEYISLPLHHNMGFKEIDYICKTISEGW